MTALFPLPDESVFDQLRWGENGLLPAIAQQKTDGRILMLAWMNRDSLRMTIAERCAVYWSRSRQCLWRKGDSSGHVQHVDDIWLDCDADTIVLQVRQHGGIACHTGRPSCFFRRLNYNGWQECDYDRYDSKS